MAVTSLHGASQLIREDYPGRPVAAYHKEKRYLHVLRISQHPYIEIDLTWTEATLDQVVCKFASSVHVYLHLYELFLMSAPLVSFLLAERLRRERNCT